MIVKGQAAASDLATIFIPACASRKRTSLQNKDETRTSSRAKPPDAGQRSQLDVSQHRAGTAPGHPGVASGPEVVASGLGMSDGGYGRANMLLCKSVGMTETA